MKPERRERIQAVLNNRQPDLIVVLENVFDPHNIAAVMRSCDAVGVQELFIVKTELPRHHKFGRRTSGSAAKWLTIHEYDNLDACMQAVRRRVDKIYAAYLDESAATLYQLDCTQPVALVFGNERDGVSAEALRYCDGNFIIPQVGMVKSLNISVACAISLYEAFRQRSEAGTFYNGVSAMDRNIYEALHTHWLEGGNATSNQ